MFGAVCSRPFRSNTQRWGARLLALLSALAISACSQQEGPIGFAEIALGEAPRSVAQKLGANALTGPTCGGRNAVFADRDIYGEPAHFMAFFDRSGVTDMELVYSYDNISNALDCDAAFGRISDAVGSAFAFNESRVFDTDTAFAQIRTIRHELQDGVALSLEQLYWPRSGNCFVRARFGPASLVASSV